MPAPFLPSPRPSALQLLVAILLLVFVAGYVVPNIVRYPWHAIVFVVIAIGLASATGAGEWLIERVKASRHPAARRCLAMSRTLVAVINGVPPYNAGRWWIVRTLVQTVFYAMVFAASLAVIVAIGFVFTQMDGKLPP